MRKGMEQELESMSHAVRSQLASLGWTDNDGPALVKKVYQTAVGNREALVYLKDFGQDTDCFLLTGSYWSEGQNCLEPSPVPIPKSGSLELVRQQVIQFALQAEAAIDESYARKLHLCWGSVNTIQDEFERSKNVSRNGDV